VKKFHLIEIKELSDLNLKRDDKIWISNYYRSFVYRLCFLHDNTFA